MRRMNGPSGASNASRREVGDSVRPHVREAGISRGEQFGRHQPAHVQPGVLCHVRLARREGHVHPDECISRLEHRLGAAGEDRVAALGSLLQRPGESWPSGVGEAADVLRVIAGHEKIEGGVRSQTVSKISADAPDSKASVSSVAVGGRLLRDFRLALTLMQAEGNSKP
jgi:hypothetical protein